MWSVWIPFHHPGHHQLPVYHVHTCVNMAAYIKCDFLLHVSIRHTGLFYLYKGEMRSATLNCGCTKCFNSSGELCCTKLWGVLRVGWLQVMSLIKRSSTWCAQALLYKRPSFTGVSFHFNVVWMRRACQHIFVHATSTSARPTTEIATF